MDPSDPSFRDLSAKLEAGLADLHPGASVEVVGFRSGSVVVIYRYGTKSG